MKNDVRADLEQFVASCRSVVDEYDLQKQLFEYLEKSKKNTTSQHENTRFTTPICQAMNGNQMPVYEQISL